mmetsp:Transcript_30221/g.78099  ORF Transcript_30221/g.78099 Transcript_30221/m.78099 type:complete len:97 (+) Transcript_30221:2751-3041(+)
MVICDVVNANLDLEDVVLKAWGALHNLASEDYVKEQLITLSAISLVRRTLKQHPSSRRIFLCVRDCGRRLYLYWSGKEKQEFDLLIASAESALGPS